MEKSIAHASPIEENPAGEMARAPPCYCLLFVALAGICQAKN